MLAEMGEHQLTIHDYMRHSNLHVTNKCLAGNIEDQTLGGEHIGERYFADGYLTENNLIQ